MLIKETNDFDAGRRRTTRHTFGNQAGMTRSITRKPKRGGGNGSGRRDGGARSCGSGRNGVIFIMCYEKHRILRDSAFVSHYAEIDP